MNKRTMFMIGVVSAALLTSAGAVNATPTKNTIYVDGTKVNGAAYMINNNNYFKLRDVAAMVNGSTKQFEVSWNETNKRIDLTTNKAYTVVGGEMALPSSAVKTAKESKASVFKDGNKADYTGYNISDNNYYKLEEKHLLHRYKEAVENYDLPNIVVISLGKKADKDKLIHLLQVLFTESKRTFDSKKEILEQEYGINMTPEMEKEMNTMCNLSLNISEEAWNEGIQKGIKMGEDSALNQTAIRFLSMGLSVDDVSKGTGLSREAVKKIKDGMKEE